MLCGFSKNAVAAIPGIFMLMKQTLFLKANNYVNKLGPASNKKLVDIKLPVPTIKQGGFYYV